MTYYIIKKLENGVWQEWDVLIPFKTQYEASAYLDGMAEWFGENEFHKCQYRIVERTCVDRVVYETQ